MPIRSTTPQSCSRVCNATNEGYGGQQDCPIPLNVDVLMVSQPESSDTLPTAAMPSGLSWPNSEHRRKLRSGYPPRTSNGHPQADRPAGRAQ